MAAISVERMGSWIVEEKDRDHVAIHEPEAFDSMRKTGLVDGEDLKGEFSSTKLFDLPQSGKGQESSAPHGESCLWVSRLKAFVEPESDRLSEETLEMEVQERLHYILEDRRRENEETGSVIEFGNEIPTFYVKKPSENSLAARVKRVARLRFLKRQSDALMNEVELDAIWMHLRRNVSGPEDPSAPGDKINYDDFCQVALICEEETNGKCKRFFNPPTFMMFDIDDFGRIPILPFYLYIMRSTSLTQTRIDLCMLDTDGDGYLKLSEMEAYIKRLVPNLPQLNLMDDNFINLYCSITSRRFFFFCDPQRRGKLLIRDLLMTPILAELMELRQATEDVELNENWFSLQNTLRIYNLFRMLDTDMNGTLSKRELLQYSNRNLTHIFIDRVFDEHVRRVRGERGTSREMDINSFVDFFLAMEERQTPESLCYIFRCVDLHSQGFITAAEIHTLFREVYQKWVEGGNYELNMEDVRVEIWDMVKPKDPLRITLSDLMECRQGDIVVGMLIDSSAFWHHDNRESLAQQEQDEEI